MNLPSRSGEGQLAGVALTFRAVLRGTSGSPKDRLEYWVMPSPDSQAHQKKQSKMDCFFCLACVLGFRLAFHHFELLFHRSGRFFTDQGENHDRHTRKDECRQ